ncbi:MAG TPA: hypothetical protein PKC89_07045 [Pyrinomonadaceae bacterium]|nr:hypothetical protein [Pyrinomonadaceae bacterium]
MRRLVAVGFFLAILSSVTIFAQSGELVSAVEVGRMNAEQFNKRTSDVYGADAPVPLNGRLTLYKVTYRSKDARGRNTILSGLIVIPSNGAQNGLVLFNHGTIVYRQAAPSRFSGQSDGSEVETATLAFGSGGYVIAMPDYIGLGDNLEAHPYPANVVNALAGIDLVKAARALARRHKVTLGRRIFVTGYSEGGGVGMAQAREIEKMNDKQVQLTAAAPAAGPYDLSGSTREFMLEQPTDQTGFVVRTYLMGYLVYYLHKEKGLKITDYFKNSMAFTINNSYGGKTKDEDVVKRIGLTAVLMRSKNSIFNVVTPRFRRVIETFDVRDPAAKLLKDNDCYDWQPKAPMMLIYLDGDRVVSPANSEKAFRTMRGRGAGRNTLRRSIIQDTQLNHLTAVPEAMLRARNFFDRGFAGVRGLDEN